MINSIKKDIKQRDTRAYLFLFIASFVFLFFYSSCRHKEPPPDKTPHYAPQELKDYCYFLPGTYWIYKDSATGIEDSVYVVSAANSIDTVYDSEGKLQGIFEWFTVLTVSSYDGYNYNYSFSASFSSGCNPNTSIPCHRVDKTKFKIGDYAGEVTFFLYKPEVGTWLYSSCNFSDGILKISRYFDSVSILSNTYKYVVEINNSTDKTYNCQETIHFFSKNIGVIKKYLKSDTKIWLLDRYNIVQ